MSITGNDISTWHAGNSCSISLGSFVNISVFPGERIKRAARNNSKMLKQKCKVREGELPAVIEYSLL